MRPLPLLRRLTLLAALLPGLAYAGGSYLFSPVNQYGINVTAEYWNPIIRYVTEKSGVALTLKIGRTSADTTSFVLAKEVDFAFTNHLFSPDRKKLGWRVIGRRATPPIHGVIVVPADSPITDLAQLAGQPVGFPGPEATVSYKMTYAHLLSRGIDVNVVFGGNTDAALVQLFSGRVKAVGANSQLVEGYARREDKQFRILWRTEPVHDLALMASPQVPAADARAVAEAFAGMATDPVGADLLRQASQRVELPENTAFVRSDGSEYGVYDQFYRTAPPQLH